MANPSAITEGSAGLKLPLLVGPTGTVYLPAAGDAVGLSGGWDSGRAPILTQMTPTDFAKLLGADTFKPFDLSTVTTEQTVWDPATGKKFRLLGFTLKASAATTLTFIDGTGGSTIFTIGFETGQAQLVDLGLIGILSGAINRNLMVVSTDAADLVGTAWGREE